MGIPQNTTNQQFTCPAAANGVSITPSATPWANSSWVQLIASTDADWILTGIIVHPDVLNDSETFEVDISTGAAASEVVVTTFRGSYRGTFYVSPGIVPCPIPLDHIASGARVAARLRKSNNSTDVWTVAATFYKKPLSGALLTTAKPQKVYPPAADNIDLTIGAGAWLNSTWTQITASTATAIVLVGAVVIAGFNTDIEYDIGIGAAAAEVPIVTVRFTNTSVSVGTDGPSFIPFYAPLDAIPISTRISARTRMSAVTARGAHISLVYLEKPL